MYKYIVLGISAISVSLILYGASSSSISLALGTVEPIQPAAPSQPPLSLLDNVTLTREQSEWQDHLKFQELIYTQQNPPDCTTAKLAIYSPFISGMGSTLTIQKAAFISAFSIGRTFIWKNFSQPHANPNFCPQRTNDCYFLPISKCTTADVQPGEATNDTSPTALREKRVIEFRFFPPSKRGTAVGQSSLQRTYSEAWVMKELNNFMLQPNPKFTAYIDSWKTVLGLADEPYVSLHIRSGWRVPTWLMAAETKTIFAVEQYYGVAKYVAYLHNTSLIFVSTDSPYIFAQLDELGKKDGLKFRHIPWSEYASSDLPEHDLSKTLEKMVRSAEYSANTKKDEAQVMLANIMLLATGIHFIGTIASNVGRVIYQLMWRGSGGPAFFDMDNDLLWDNYGLKTNLPRVRFLVAGKTTTKAKGTPCLNEMQLEQNSNNCYSQIPGPRKSSSECFYGGMTDTANECKDLCLKLGNCTSFTWHAPFIRTWGHMCYYRVDGIWDPTTEPLHTAGACLKAKEDTR